MKIPVKSSVVYAGYGFGSGDGGSASEYYHEGVLVGVFSKVDFKGNAVLAPNGDTLEVDITGGGISGLEISDEDTSIGTFTKLNFEGAAVNVVDEGAGKATVTFSPSPSDLTIKDEGSTVTTTAKKINFIGDYVRVRPVVPISEWNLLSDVEPSMDAYPGQGGNPEEVDVLVEVPDSSIIKNITCDPSALS